MIRAWQLVAPNLAVVGAYFLAGKFGLSLAFFHASASAVWPPSGIALAALLLWGYRLWPGIFLGAFLVNITTQGSAATTLGIATGNTLEAVIGAWLVGRYAGGLKAFERARNVFKFVVLAAILSTAVSATLGVTSLSLGGFAAWEDYQHIWLTWWLGDMVGNLTVAPLLVIWLTQPLFPLTAKQFVEGAALLLTVILIGWFVFFGRLGFGDHFEYFAILPLLWAAFRFGQRGAVTYAFMMSGIALSGTLKGVGPFATPDPNESLLLLQAFMGTVTMTALVFASVAFERKRAEQRLQVQDAVSRMLAESPKLTEAAPKIVQVLCERAGWEVGAIWSLDQNKRELACVEFWHLPASNVPEFESITRRLRFSPGMGLPGRVWSNGESAWIPDVTMESNFPRAPIAVKEGLHAAVGFPIKLGNEILGVIECFSREIREPDDDFLEMVSHIGAQLGQFMERKRAEEALRAKEAQLRVVTDITPVLLTQCSRELRYTFVNRACAELLGLTPEEIIGKSISAIMGAEAYETIRPYVETVLQGRAVEYEAEIPYERRGRRFMRAVYMPDRDIQGNVRGWVASISDITDRKRAEAALQEAKEELAKANERLERRVQERTAELERANAAILKDMEQQKRLEEQLRQAQKMESIGTLAGGIAHDFNNILNIIRGYASLIGRHPSADEKIAESVQVIDETIDRGASVVRQLLTVARKTSAHLVPADLNQLVSQLSTLLKGTFPKNIDISLQLEPKLPSITADPNQINQAVLNLCVNARDAMPNGGELLISTEVVPGADLKYRFHEAKEEQYACIAVTDTGTGMDDATKVRIFEPFFTTKDQGQGTGLGLSVVYGIVTNHAGFIEVTGQAGRGACFCVYLPVPEEETKSFHLRKPEHKELGGR